MSSFFCRQKYRLLRRQRSGHALIDMAELRVPVGMIATLIGLAVGLQTELLRFQQLTDHGATDLMPAGHKLRRQLPQALAGGMAT
jgi:hypothetical protein